MGIMGASTFAVGLLPSYASVGTAAPLMLVGLRLLQGLALGGQYGGAATYVAEHAPEGKRGFYTSFIQTTATLGLFASLLVVIGTRTLLGEEAFADWGWRLPFFASAILLGVSLWIRLQLNESPVYKQMKDAGATSKAPLTEAFGNWKNARLVLVALLGAVAGQAVVWYTGQFYALFYLERILKVDGGTANILIATALLIGTPFFVFFGWLSDRIGRKPIIMTGCALAALLYFPLFGALTEAANPALAQAQARNPVTVYADPASCSVQFDPIGKATFDKTGCDIVKSGLAKAGVPYSGEPLTEEVLRSTELGLNSPDIAYIRIGDELAPVSPVTKEAFNQSLPDVLKAAGYPAAGEAPDLNKPLVVAILTVLVLLVTMVYGPIAALLVELFPARIRYTALSLPYHIGNGWFGGFLPTIAFAMVAATGDIYAGLWYPVGVAALTLVVGLLFLPETFRRRIDHGS
jgi:MFS family permease